MSTFRERAADIIFALCLCVILVISHFGFEGKTLVLLAPDPGHRLTFLLFTGA